MLTNMGSHRIVINSGFGCGLAPSGTWANGEQDRYYYMASLGNNGLMKINQIAEKNKSSNYWTKIYFLGD